MVQLMEKMSLNPAILYLLEEHKGWIGKGADADLVIFDPGRLLDSREFPVKIQQLSLCRRDPERRCKVYHLRRRNRMGESGRITKDPPFCTADAF